MWPPWLSSPSRFLNTPPPSPPLSHSGPRSGSFSCSTFKDIQSLLQEQPEPEPASSPKTSSLFRRVRISASVLRAWGSRASLLPPPPPHALPPGLEHGVVVYFTSLRVVRRTFEDCRSVRAILRGLGAAVDERDVSIDDRFRDELSAVLGRQISALPRVFVGGEYIGGADEVRRLHESGELQHMIEQLPSSNAKIGCDRCGGFRFVVCDECDGSHKVFTEKSGGFRSCSSCNANGLIRCPACFFVHPRRTK